MFVVQWTTLLIFVEIQTDKKIWARTNIDIVCFRAFYYKRYIFLNTKTDKMTWKRPDLVDFWALLRKTNALLLETLQPSDWSDQNFHSNWNWDNLLKNISCKSLSRQPRIQIILLCASLEQEFHCWLSSQPWGNADDSILVRTVVLLHNLWVIYHQWVLGACDFSTDLS